MSYSLTFVMVDILRRGVFDVTEDERSEISELINRRRHQLLVHSIIYYKLNDNLISDSQWTEWAVELEELQSKYPDIAAEGYHAKEFEKFDHSTGFNLPLDDPYAVIKAQQLLYMRDKGNIKLR